MKLDNNLIKKVFGWKPKWHIGKTITEIVKWTKVYIKNKDDIPSEMNSEIREFFNL